MVASLTALPFASLAQPAWPTRPLRVPLVSPAVLEAFRTGGIASRSGTPAQFADFMRLEIARYAEVIQRVHISVEG
ncbi:hypothetical protein [Ramlibacter sp.]|uniref:hypothetical protein n=1 Tax=Ramlibacter sp. TaxID=1917967 RepID=UPI002635BF50|nr:hypothetical protein [Ramlibacter sp.]